MTTTITQTTNETTPRLRFSDRLLHGQTVARDVTLSGQLLAPCFWKVHEIDVAV